MPVGATIGAAGALGSAGIGLFGSLSASSQQANAEKAALAQQQAMFGVAQGALQPYIDTGKGVGSTLTSLLTPGPNQTSTLSQIPGFQFAQDWGQKAVQNLGTTTGLGGNTLTAGANFATGLAQQNFGQLINPLLSLYGTGESAAGALANGALGFGAQIGQTQGAIGTAQAQGTLGATNAIGAGLTGGANSITNSILLSKLFGGSGIGGSSSSNPGIYSTGAIPYAGAPFSAGATA